MPWYKKGKFVVKVHKTTRTRNKGIRIAKINIPKLFSDQFDDV